MARVSAREHGAMHIRFVTLSLVSLALAGACGAAPVEHTRALRVMTVNLRHNKDFVDERVPLLAAEIASMKPDVVGMQEVEVATDQGHTLLAAVQAIDPSLDYAYDEQLKHGPAAVAGEGIGVFFRGTSVGRDVLEMSDGRVALFKQVDFGDGLVVDLFDTHLTAIGASEGGDDMRAVQAQQIVAFMNAHDDGHAEILTGDMNSTPDTAAYGAYVDGGLVDAWPAVHPQAPGPTSPVVLSHDPATVQTFKRRIDYVFTDGRTTPTDASICFDTPAPSGLYPTDHLGVMTTLTARWTTTAP